MKLVAFDEMQHYPLMLIWWSERGYPATPLHLLPPIGLVMESDEGQPIVAGFLYGSDGGCAQISHLVADPAIKSEARSALLDALISQLTDLARSRGFRQITGATNLPRLVERYQRLGFQICDERVTLLAKEF